MILDQLLLVRDFNELSSLPCRIVYHEKAVVLLAYQLVGIDDALVVL